MFPKFQVSANGKHCNQTCLRLTVMSTHTEEIPTIEYQILILKILLFAIVNFEFDQNIFKLNKDQGEASASQLKKKVLKDASPPPLVKHKGFLTKFFFSRTRRRAAHQYIKKKRGKDPQNAKVKQVKYIFFLTKHSSDQTILLTFIPL